MAPPSHAYSRPKVLRLGIIESAHDAWAQVEEIAEIVAPVALPRCGKESGVARGCPPSVTTPQGKVLGILGMGGIGRNMARKARVFGMQIQYHNRKPIAPELEAECEARYVNFDELLKTSDVISLNLRLNDNTRHIISTPQFDIMKKGVVIVNTARGAVIDENALVAALDEGHVASAGLDVYENEPQVHEGLLANPNVLIVPHMGTWTEETQTKMEEWTISNVVSAIERGELRSIVPEQKIPVAGP
ncbi:glyoxylate reductase [Verticillium alfalfae VaMs.102]|uniref:Glyoxylate reductase n=1 Tax=Verticillium alfalfae (strain VaMs.102 / ATCC MYA-4576 / FGSC 10136) TaxID=526221 RepID=C9S872_VERA1|nr:glyoxylate reductase [Verticillium alfalfae VaMs.102]EEY15322.1 glyoxylate reductase [Verticillium alfalfae VaMs.102]